MTENFDVTCEPLFEFYSSPSNNNLSEEDIFKLCQAEFEETFKGNKIDKYPMLGHLYSEETWSPDIWNNDIKHVSHEVKKIWVEQGKLKATLEMLKSPLTENFNQDQTVKYIAKICYGDFVTRLTKIDILH